MDFWVRRFRLQLSIESVEEGLVQALAVERHAKLRDGPLGCFDGQGILLPEGGKNRAGRGEVSQRDAGGDRTFDRGLLRKPDDDVARLLNLVELRSRLLGRLVGVDNADNAEAELPGKVGDLRDLVDATVGTRPGGDETNTVGGQRQPARRVPTVGHSEDCDVVRPLGYCDGGRGERGEQLSVELAVGDELLAVTDLRKLVVRPLAAVADEADHLTWFECSRNFRATGRQPGLS